jgi:hypothetical protein
VTLTPKKKTNDELDQLFSLIAAADIPDTFMAARDNQAGEFREIF